MKKQILIVLILLTVSAFASPKKPSPPPKYGEAGDVTTTRAGLAVSGRTLFATIDSTATKPRKTKVRGLAAISIATPGQPTLLSTLPLDGPYPQDVAVQGDFAFVVDGLNLWTINVANPAAMQVVAKTPLATEGEKGPRAIVLSVDGKSAYLACGRAGVMKVDLSIPAAPKTVWTLPTKFSRSVALLVDATSSSRRQGEFIVSAEELSGLAVIRDGKVVASAPLDFGGAVNVRTAGEKIFVANGARLVQIWKYERAGGTLDPADAGRLVKLVGYGMPALSFFGTYAYDAVPSGDRVYVADGESGIYELDVTGAEPKILRETGKLNLPSVKTLVIAGDWLYASVNSVDGPSSIFTVPLKGAFAPVGSPLALK